MKIFFVDGNNRYIVLYVEPMDNSYAASVVKRMHYLKRSPSISYAYGLFDAVILGNLYGVLTFGTPASRHLMIGACKKPEMVIELNRLWVDDCMPKNTESWFVSRAIKQMPPYMIVSYADTAYGHNGYIYRALNFKYAGITDMDRKTPRFSYVNPNDTNRHDRHHDSSWLKVRRKPKHRYWILSGGKREKKKLAKLVLWPSLKWGDYDNI